MMQFVVSALAAGLGVLVASKVSSKVHVKSAGTLVAVAVVFGVLNALLNTVLSITLGVALLPLGLVTLGLIYVFLGIFVNMILLWLTDKFISNFEVKSFSTMFVTACLVSLATVLVEHFVH